MQGTLRIVAFIAVLAGASGIAEAEEGIRISRTDRAIEFDGFMTEAAWEQAEPFEMVMYTPVFGNSVSEQSDIRLLYDDDYIYVGAMLYDRDPSKIQVTSKKRDEFGGGCDWFGVILDTYNDNENALGFLTTPSGLRTDAAVFNDAEGDMENMPVNQSWNTFWDVLTHITGQGWSVEMRIPLSSLRFQEEEGAVTMGLIIWRWIPHLNEVDIFPAIPPEFGPFGMWKPSKAGHITFTGIKGSRPLYVTPYAAGGLEQLNELNEDETEYVYESRPKVDAGLDIKYGVTSNLTLDLTVNTDFAQVEADDQIVNLSRFSYFFPEKRQFFLERSSIFEFKTGGPNNMMFYSRRIGLNEEELVRIYGGARIIGRKGPWDIGAMNMQTARSDELPSENFSVLRLKRRTFNTNSYIGGILTSRLGMNGDYNAGYGLDGLINVTGDEYLRLVLAQNHETGVSSSPASLHPSRMHLSWQRRRDVGFFYDVFASYSGRNFNPGIGFQSLEDYSVAGTFLGQGWLGTEASGILKHAVRLRSMNILDNSHEQWQMVQFGPSYDVEMKSGLNMSITAQYNHENIFEDFELSDEVSVPVGEYRFFSFEGFFMTPMSNPLMAILMTEAGGFYDGTRLSVSVLPTWSVSPSLELSGYYQYNRARFPEREQDYLAHIMRVKALYMFSTRLSASAFVQFNSADAVGVVNFRFRYNPREGNDFYIVYNEGRNSDLERDLPELPLRPGMSYRTILLKYTYTFIL